MSHISLDLETLDTKPEAVVLSVGAVKFHPHRLGVLSEKFYMVVNVEQQMLKDRSISASTLAWWMQQDDKARLALFGPAVLGSSVIEVLTRFTTFCKNTEGVWGNGATFDNIILKSLFYDFNVPWPVPYYGDRDLRTLKDLAGGKRAPKVTRSGTHHNALDDAEYQAHCVQAYYDAIVP